jgi:DNA mismatch repair ATPase MutS
MVSAVLLHVRWAWKVRLSNQEPCCRPEFVEGPSVLEIEELRHPCVQRDGMDFIPNDITLANDAQSMILLTGPNMVLSFDL